MIERKQIPHSYTVLLETGHIQVRLDTVVRDTDTGEELARKPWRGVVDAGDTRRADELLGDHAEAAKELAGRSAAANGGGWAELERQRAAMIAAAQEAEAVKK